MVMPPTKRVVGGRVYWAMRNACETWMYGYLQPTQKFATRNFTCPRWSATGLPNLSYDPKNNEWGMQCDVDEHKGIAYRAWMGFQYSVTFYLGMVFVPLWVYDRWETNGKWQALFKH
mmetsp:Transcript_28787/g.56407  ORF Transcript_28787/g.56407 Transcript_28787/m.56407 type:complete len:117 (+) Transcript_28787:169-519(+)